MTDERDLIEQWFQRLINEADYAVCEEILADEIAYHGPRSVTPVAETPDDVERYLRRFHETFPNITYEVEDVFGSGGKYCARWTARGTQEGDLFGIEGGGGEFHDEGLNAFLIRDGEIAEIWAYWDTLAMVQDLGMLSPLGLEAAGSETG